MTDVGTFEKACADYIRRHGWIWDPVAFYWIRPGVRMVGTNAVAVAAYMHSCDQHRLDPEGPAYGGQKIC